MIYVVDTTLRDGEQKANIVLNKKEKITIAQMIDKLGIHSMEIGIPAMGGCEKEAIQEICSLRLKSELIVWNRLNKNDIKQSLEINNVVIHISIPSSDIQIYHKIKKDRQWVLENLKECIQLAKSKGHKVTVGLEDASRADDTFIYEIIELCLQYGIARIRYADTVGVLNRETIYFKMKEILGKYNVLLEFHAHNDFGMAVANSIAATLAGCQYIDCTIGGIGERAGNCEYYAFIKAAKKVFNQFGQYDLNYIEKAQKKILNRILKNKVLI